MTFAYLFALQSLGNGVFSPIVRHSIERFGVVGALTAVAFERPALVA